MLVSEIPLFPSHTISRCHPLISMLKAVPRLHQGNVCSESQWGPAGSHLCGWSCGQEPPRPLHASREFYSVSSSGPAGTGDQTSGSFPGDPFCMSPTCFPERRFPSWPWKLLPPLGQGEAGCGRVDKDGPLKGPPTCCVSTQKPEVWYFTLSPPPEYLSQMRNHHQV